MLKIVIIFIPILVSCLTFGQSAGTIQYLAIKEEIPTVNFQLPDVTEWNLVMDVPPEPGNKGALMFKHKPIEVAAPIAR